MTKAVLTQALSETTTDEGFPTELKLPVDGKDTPVIVQYAFDGKLQETMEKLFRQYRPDYGAFVALDAATGRVLALISHGQIDRQRLIENMALRASFPSASIFKIVTAAAAIAEKNFSAETIIPFNGRSHTLYRSAILRDKQTRWTRYITLKDAFAQSVNPVFGKIGAFTVGAAELRNYADRFGFNRRIASDIPMQEGKADIRDDAWSLAESASGFTRDNTMSPLQGALIAAAVVNNGTMMEPWVIDSVHSLDGTPLYAAEPAIARQSVNERTAHEVRKLMQQTVVKGTSRKSFRGFFRGDMRELEVGGKTGSLSGKDPVGKYDWFIGYADNGKHKMAIAALTVHKHYWKVKSSYLARRAIEEYFSESLSEDTFAKLGP